MLHGIPNPNRPVVGFIIKRIKRSGGEENVRQVQRTAPQEEVYVRIEGL